MGWLGGIWTAIDWVLDRLATRKDAIQSAAIVVGSIWGYFRFVRGRTFATRAKVANHVEALEVDREWRQLRVSVEVANTGNRHIRPLLIQCQVRQLRPLTGPVLDVWRDWFAKHERARTLPPTPPGDYMQIARATPPPQSYYDNLIEWPVLDAQVMHLYEDVSDLEPGESDMWPLDLAIPAGAERVQVHTLVWLDGWRFWTWVQAVRRRAERAAREGSMLERLVILLLPVYWETRTTTDLQPVPVRTVGRLGDRGIEEREVE